MIEATTQNKIRDLEAFVKCCEMTNHRPRNWEKVLKDLETLKRTIH